MTEVRILYQMTFERGCLLSKVIHKGELSLTVLVSACLLGENCKYNGGNNYNPQIAAFLADKNVIPICPEIFTGLGAPRQSVELVNGKIRDSRGNDLDDVYRRGVSIAIEKIENTPIDLAILQSRSPTCGVRQIYDGSFFGRLIPGQGLFARELIRRGIKTIDSADFSESR